LVIYDRGYPALWLFALHLSLGVDCVMRLARKQFKEAEPFWHSDAPSALITLQPCAEQARACRDQGVEPQPITLRLVRVKLKGGETEVLATTVLEETRVAARLFKDLYHRRWGVGVSGEGHLIQSVEVRPRPIDSSLVAWEAPWRESKAVKPSDRVRNLAYSNLPGCNVQ